MNKYEIKRLSDEKITHRYWAEAPMSHKSSWGLEEREKRAELCTQEELDQAIGDRTEDTLDQEGNVVNSILYKILPATYQVIVTDVTSEEKVNKARQLRQAKLQEVDDARNYMLWAEAAGTPWSSQKKSDWAAYRQLLLDITDSVDANTDVDALVWPQAPVL